LRRLCTAVGRRGGGLGALDDDGRATRRFPAVTTERAAAATVAALARADPSNPPIVWQLTDPWWSATRRARAPHLVVHLAKFLDQRLDGDTGGWVRTRELERAGVVAAEREGESTR
jgi:hypothetical protein